MTTKTDIRDGIGWITLDRPEVRNALSSELMEAIGAAVDAFEADDAVRALVITGSGPAFPTGRTARGWSGRYGGAAASPPTTL